MTENDIRGYVATFVGAAIQDDSETAVKAASVLVEQVLVDLHRIADTLEEMLATKERT